MSALARTVAATRLGRLPVAVVTAIAAAWLAAIAAQATGAAALLHHDALIEGGTAGLPALALFLLAWQLMVVAMMLPSSLPLVVLFSRASGRQPRPRAAMAAFLAGYVFVWSAFGAAALGLDLAVHEAVDANAWLAERGWLLGAALLAGAGAFQFTSLKDACLDKCRHPAQFMTRFYERGVVGGLRFGTRHGAYCVGCCWALMLVMFAAGVASLAGMALLTALMVHEKTQRRGREAVPVTGVALLTVAAAVAVYGVSVGGTM